MKALTKSGAAALAAALLCAQAPAPSPPPADPLALIKAQVRPVSKVADSAFAGPAWDALVEDAAGAQFTMVGEQHGSGDIARFAAALHRALAARGYTHSALEVGPFSTAFAERLIRSGPGRLQRYIATPRHGFTLPFLFFAEEAAMAEQMVGSSPDKRQALFGLDQEFVGAAPILTEELATLASNASRRAAVSALRASSAADPMLLAKLDEVRLGSLATLFADSPRALAIINAIRISARIYKPFLTHAGSTYPANLERETYMKMNFVRQFEAALRRNERAPKVFLKFGGLHAMRGMSGTNVPALGNFLAEWGLPRNYRMVNLMVDCIGGQSLNPQTNAPGPCAPYFPSDSALGKALADGPEIQIVDLRQLRPQLGKLKQVDETTRKVILAFDYYVAIRGGRAATPVGQGLPR